MNKKIYKIENGKKVSGVCGGLAEYFNVDPSLVRILCVFICLWKGIGILVYFVASFILPTKSEVEREEQVINGQSSDFY